MKNPTNLGILTEMIYVYGKHRKRTVLVNAEDSKTFHSIFIPKAKEILAVRINGVLVSKGEYQLFKGVLTIVNDFISYDMLIVEYTYSDGQ